MSLRFNRLLSSTYLCTEPAGLYSLLGHHSLPFDICSGCFYSLIFQIFYQILQHHAAVSGLYLIFLQWFMWKVPPHLTTANIWAGQVPSQGGLFSGVKTSQIKRFFSLPTLLRLVLLILRLFQCLIFGQKRERTLKWQVKGGRQTEDGLKRGWA